MRRILLALACMSLLATTPVFADSHEDAPNLADVWLVKVKPGHGSEFEDAFKAHIAKRAEAGDTRDWNTYSPVIGDHMEHYVIRYCCMTWADQDAYTAWSMENEALGQDWDENVDPHVASYHHYIDALDFENSHWPEDSGPFRYFGVTRWYPKEDAMGISAIKKEFSDLAKEHNWPRQWSWGDTIGGRSMMFLVSPFQNYADMAPPEKSFYEVMSEAMGSEEAAREKFQEFNSKFDKSTYTVYVHREDMSMGDDD